MNGAEDRLFDRRIVTNLLLVIYDETQLHVDCPESQMRLCSRVEKGTSNYACTCWTEHVFAQIKTHQRGPFVFAFVPTCSRQWLTKRHHMSSPSLAINCLPAFNDTFSVAPINKQTPWSKVLLQNFSVLSAGQDFIQLQCSLPCSQQSTIDSCPKPD